VKRNIIRKKYFIHKYITIITFLVRVSYRNEGKMGSHKSGVHWLDQVTESKWCMSVVCASTNFGGHPVTMFLTITEKDHEPDAPDEKDLAPCGG
jgi:hypothetical protein